MPLHDGTRDVTLQILEALDTKPSFDTSAEFPQIAQNEVKAALDRLASRLMITYETKDTEQVLLTPEAQTICDEGSHEFKVWDAVKKQGKIEIKELAVSFSSGHDGFTRSEVSLSDVSGLAE